MNLESELKALTQAYLDEGHTHKEAVRMAGEEIERYMVQTQLVSPNQNGINVRTSRGSEYVEGRDTNPHRTVGYSYSDTKPKN